MRATMDVERDVGGGTGSARRRRERRLRSMLRHERAAVATAVAESTHHSSRGQKSATVIREEEVHETYDGPRAQKRPPGERPGILAEPWPQRSDRTVWRSVGDTHPTLGLPVLAGASGEVMDTSTLAFLTRSLMQLRKQEEEVQAMLEEVRPSAATVSSSSGTVARAVRSGIFLPLPRGASQ